MIVAAAGRLQIGELLQATVAQLEAGGETGGWGMAYCYGNRLEVVRSAEACAVDPGFKKLSELRTDMLVLVPDNRSGLAPREAQPFLRRESGKTWAFCHQGGIARPDRLDMQGRLPDSDSISERYFLHLLAHLDPGAPVESLTAALELLPQEKTLSFCLLSPDQLLVASWFEQGEGLWLGRGELVRYLSSHSLKSLPETDWEPLPNRNVLAIARSRRELP